MYSVLHAVHFLSLCNHALSDPLIFLMLVIVYLYRSGEYVSIQSMDRHPHQPHLIVLGRGDGSLCFWDLRQDNQPVQIIQGHTSDGE